MSEVEVSEIAVDAAPEQAATEEVKNTPESATDEVEQQPESTPDEAEQHKKGFQKRIDKLTRQKSEVEREVEYWKQQALKQQAIAQPQETKIETQDKPSAENFESYDEYIDALTDWKLTQKEQTAKKQNESERLKQTIDEKVASFKASSEQFASATPDYEDVLEGVDHIQITPSFENALLESKYGAQVAYELAKDPERFAKINQMPVLQAAIEIGKVEASIDMRKQTSQAKPTNAPAPINPVGGSAPAVKSESEMSDSEWYKSRQKLQFKK